MFNKNYTEQWICNIDLYYFPEHEDIKELIIEYCNSEDSKFLKENPEHGRIAFIIYPTGDLFKYRYMDSNNLFTNFLTRLINKRCDEKELLFKEIFTYQTI